ncbi:oxepin-CoA hydrolase, alternative type [Mesorhizobium xinjiangense]|uniref:oxepin-CoA hydrolase, alternative type n=1 Tax=Mesorhizobium xinjiangense TaxID=2678685 RepID=UPI0012ED602F|nr:enoyl-CoA hydratase family protein [Mesorhizobium xinjiangense]
MTPTTTRLITETRADGVRILTLDGAGTRNAIGPAIYAELSAAIIDAGVDPVVRSLVLTGANGFFSSGGNVASLQEGRNLPLSDVARNTDLLGAMILAIRACPKPVIAAVEGGAAGLGLSLALACDMIAATRGARFTAAYVRIGLTPDGGATHLLCEALPRQLVSEMCLLGHPMEAERLHAAGAINRLADAGGALAAALELAQSCAGGAAGAMAVIKDQIRQAPRNGLAAQLDLEARHINAARYDDEAAEGLQAFLEKRRPRFPGAPDN